MDMIALIERLRDALAAVGMAIPSERNPSCSLCSLGQAVAPRSPGRPLQQLHGIVQTNTLQSAGGLRQGLDRAEGALANFFPVVAFDRMRGPCRSAQLVTSYFFPDVRAAVAFCVPPMNTQSIILLLPIVKLEGTLTQLVFVHGVATRAGVDYDTTVRNRTRLFTDTVFENANVQILNPYWGGESPTIDQSVFATASADNSFSLNIDRPAGGQDGVGQTVPGNDLSIVAIGSQSPVTAIDAILSGAVDTADREARQLNDEEVAAFKKAVNLIDEDRADSLFAGTPDEVVIAKRLRNDDEPRAFGLVSKIGEAVTAATDKVKNAVSTVGSKVLKSYSPAVGVFLGDVFVYLNEGETREAIRAIVLKDLQAAYVAAKAKGEPVVLVGHSLGGVILTDILSDPKGAGLPDDFKVAVFFTVGSQPGFFAALELIAKKKNPTGERLKLDCVGAWYNVFDPIDPFAFRADGHFKDVEDVEFDSVTGLMAAHSAYFTRPQFYARFRARLIKHGVLIAK